MDTDQLLDTYTDWDLYARNATILVRRAPALRSFIEKGRCDYKWRKTGDGLEVLDTAGKSVLPLPEPAYSEQRCRAFVSNPLILSECRPLQAVNADPEIWADHLQPVIKITGDRFWNRKTSIRNALTCVVIDHSSTSGMKQILEELPDLYILIFCISDVNLFVASLHTVDWSELYAVCDARDISLWLRLLPSGPDATRLILDQLARAARIMPDNIPIYSHLDSTATNALCGSLIKDFKNSNHGVGFFRDEIIMLENTIDNILERNRPLLCRQPSNIGTALVVGSGPSLDQSLDNIKAMSENCFIVACGTAVEPLLLHGIRVDACVVLERGLTVEKVFSGVADRVDLSSVVLIASSTVHPGVEDSFKRGVYFFRPGLNVSPGFDSKNEHTLQGCDPTVANTGIAVAYFLGFRRIIFFGVDVGSVDETLHHSKNSAYYTEHSIEKLKKRPMPLKVEASFGGTARTSTVFNWSRYRMEDFAIVFDDVVSLNLSDGAVLPATQPILPENAPILSRVFPFADKVDLTVDIEEKEYDPENYEYDPEHLDRYMQRIRSVSETLSWDNRINALLSINTFLWAQSSPNPYQRIVRGTITKMVTSIVGALMRMTEGEREAHEACMREALLIGIDGMHKELSDLIRYGIRKIPPDDPSRG